MVYPAHFALVLVACVLTMLLLARARWTWHAPRVAIVCLQAAGLALGLAVIGGPLAIGLAPYGAPTGRGAARFAADIARGDLPAVMGPEQLAATAVGLFIAAWLLGVTGACLVRAVRARRRHRELLALVGRVDPEAPGALVLDHPSAAAYCLPGIRSAVVVSAGALDLLDRDELAAVLSHERAHAAERHDLVLFPFTALTRALPPVSWLCVVRDTVALLVEMCADDRARRQHDAAPLATALGRFAAAPAAVMPPGSLGLAEKELEARMRRLHEPPARPPWPQSTIALTVSAVLALVSVGMFVLPT